MQTVPSPELADRSVAFIRAELERVRSSLRRIEEVLATLDLPRPPPDDARQRSGRYMRVLVEVYDHGGRQGVGPDELAAIGARYGYDRRGLGGFFTGANAPLRRVDQRVQLTVYGEHLLDAYLARL